MSLSRFHPSIWLFWLLQGASRGTITDEQPHQQPEVSSISDRAPEEDAATKEAKRAALEEWRERKRSEAERAAAEEERSRQESVEAQLRRKQEQRAKKEAVALFKLEKEQRQQHEAQIKQMLEGQAKTKYVKRRNFIPPQKRSNLLSASVVSFCLFFSCFEC